MQVVGLNLVGQNLGIQPVGTPTLAFTLEVMEPDLTPKEAKITACARKESEMTQWDFYKVSDQGTRGG